MTVPTTTDLVSYVGTGATNVFVVPYRFLQAADLVVQITDLTGAIATKILNTDYTVSNTGLYTGGSITLVAGNLTTGYVLSIFRNPSPVQTTSLQNQGSYNPTAVETALDLLTMETQALGTLQAKTIGVPLLDTATVLTLPAAAARASKNMAFDSLGNVIAGTALASGTISSVMVPVVTASTLPIARSLMGVAGLTVYNVKEYPYLAKGDGSTDDTTAIQAAVTAAQAANGGVIFFPQGNYIVSNEILVTGNSLIFEGQATSGNIGGGSRIVTNSTTKDIVHVSTASQSVSGFEMRNLSLYGAGSGGTTGSGLYLQSDVAGRVIQTVRIYNVAAVNCKEHGFRFSAASNTSFVFDMAMGDLVSTGNGKNGLRADGNVIQTQVGKIYSASNLCTGGAGGQIAIVGVAGVTTPTNWLFSSPVAANNPAVANSAAVYLELARGITMLNVWHESNLNAEFILKSCLNIRVIGGNVAQAGTTDGVVIGFSGANASGNITIDIDNWVLTSSKKHVDVSQFSGGSFSLPVYLGNTADGPLTPANVTGYSGAFLPDLIFFSQNQPHLRSLNCTRLATPQSGTWTAGGQPVSWTRTSANNTTQSIAFEVPFAPFQTSTYLKGVKPSAVHVVYEVTGADAGDDVQVVVQTQAQPIDGSATPGAASVPGTYDASHATAALRSNSAGGHQFNTLVYTITTPAWLANDVEMYCIIQAVEANNAGNALSVIVRSIIFYYNENLA